MHACLSCRAAGRTSEPPCPSYTPNRCMAAEASSTPARPSASSFRALASIRTGTSAKGGTAAHASSIALRRPRVVARPHNGTHSLRSYTLLRLPPARPLPSGSAPTPARPAAATGHAAASSPARAVAIAERNGPAERKPNCSNEATTAPAPRSRSRQVRVRQTERGKGEPEPGGRGSSSNWMDLGLGSRKLIVALVQYKYRGEHAAPGPCVPCFLCDVALSPLSLSRQSERGRTHNTDNGGKIRREGMMTQLQVTNNPRRYIF